MLRGSALSKGDGEVEFRVDQGRTNPSHLELLEAGEAESIEADSLKIGNRFSYQTARRADLRDAYLWAFAEYGYRLIANQFFDPVRQVIQSGDPAPARWGLSVPKAGYPFSELHIEEGGLIAVLTQPSGALMVINGEHGHILPTPHCPDPYSTLDEGQAKISFFDRFASLPRELRATWDFLDEWPPSG